MECGAMPKEKINTVETEEYQAPGISYSITKVKREQISVSWSSPTSEANFTGKGLVYIKMLAPESRVKLLIRAEGYPNSDVPLSTPCLTREEINKLISVLRKARDQAYGKDA